MLAEFVFNETVPLSAGPSTNPVGGGGTGGGTAGKDSTGTAWTAAWPLSDWETVEIEAELGGSAGDVSDVYLQSSTNGVDWYDVAHFPQQGAGAGTTIYRGAITRHPQPTAALVVVGKNGTPALGANTIVQGGWGDRIRLWMVPGASVSVGGNVKVRISGARSPHCSG
jgi:hypothetical protein